MKTHTAQKERNHHVKGGQPDIVDMVCGMTTDDPDAWQQYEYNGRIYYFCSAYCLNEFVQHPKKFVKPELTAGKRRSI